MENKYSLSISGAAQEDFEGIFYYISRILNNPTAARNLSAEFSIGLERVCFNPLMCPLTDNRRIHDKSLRKLIVKKYIIFYRVNESKKEIQVVRVLYGMMNYEEIL